MNNEINQAVSAEQLQIEISRLKEENASLQNEKTELLAKLNWFEEHFRLNQHRLYGHSS
jgi:transposase